MNFLVDAHLPRRLARKLQEAGHNAIHTSDLPNGNRSTDSEINAVSVRENRVVITKDADFVNSFLLTGQPYKLLVVSAGNITNADLEALLLPNLSAIVTAFQTVSSPKPLDQAADGTAIPARCATRSAKVGVVSGVTMRSRR